MNTALATVVAFADLNRWDPPATTTRSAFAWPSAELAEVAEVRLGVQVPRKVANAKGVERPYLRAMNVRRGFVDTSDVKRMHVSKSQAANLALRAGDLVFVEGSGSVSEVGRAAIWDGNIPEVIHQNSVVRARLTTEELDPEFVVTWFNSRPGNAYIREQATTTSGLYHIGAGKLSAAPIPIPPLDVQRALVEAYRNTLALAETTAIESSTLTTAAWDRFVAEVVDVQDEALATDIIAVTPFSALNRWDTGVVPAGVTSPYPVLHLEDVADVRLGTQVPRRGDRVSGESVPYLRAANVQRGYVDLTDQKRMTVPRLTVERLTLLRNDILFVEGNSREEVGRAAVWFNQEPKTIIQNSVIRARLAVVPRHVVNVT